MRPATAARKGYAMVIVYSTYRPCAYAYRVSKISKYLKKFSSKLNGGAETIVLLLCPVDNQVYWTTIGASRLPDVLPDSLETSMSPSEGPLLRFLSNNQKLEVQ